MRKIFSILLVMCAAVQLAFADDVVTINTKRLPPAAHHFINRYFGKLHISHIKIESELLRAKKYEVLLTDCTEIEFDRKGNWIEVDCDKNAVPLALIPVAVREYVSANFSGEIVTKIERGRDGVEVELSNGYDLKFNEKGILVDIDD